MIELKPLIRIILDKKGWTNVRFCEEINSVRKEIGLKGETRSANITNFFNNKDEMASHSTLLIWETALGLPRGTLSDMVDKPTKATIVKEKDLVSRLDKIKR